jgi:[acyl-carrier-protein] S-malonyltransferase
LKKSVFLFPGQGAQKPGMGRDLYEAFPAAKAVFDSAPDVRDLCFTGSEEDLKQTRNTQPAVFLTSMAADAALKSLGFVPSAAAGHSLGEYSALCSAGVFSLVEGIRLVKERSRLMQKAGDEIPGTMAAIIGLDDAKVREICAGLAKGPVEPVNFNAPGQVVISGALDAVKESLAVFKTAGAKMTVPLPVSGAFHSSLLKSAAEEFRKVLMAASFQAPVFPVLANVDAEFHDVAGLADRLTRQLCGAVLWTACAAKLKSVASEVCFEAGPGNVLKGLMKKIDPAIVVETAGTAAECNDCAQKYA